MSASNACNRVASGWSAAVNRVRTVAGSTWARPSLAASSFALNKIGVSFWRKRSSCSTGFSSVLSSRVTGWLNAASVDETADKHSLARPPSRSLTNLTSAATDAASGLRALRMRSTIRGERVASAGDKRSLDLTEETNVTLSVSRSGCRLFHAIEGMSLSWPQCSSTSTRTDSASKLSILREAMATWSCTSGDGSLANSATCSRIADDTLPEFPAARTPHAWQAGSECASTFR